MKVTNEKLIKVLVTARNKNNLSQAELAKRLGCVSQFVSNFERGASSLPVDKIVAYANEVGVQLDKVRSAMKRDFDKSLTTELNKYC